MAGGEVAVRSEAQRLTRRIAASRGSLSRQPLELKSSLEQFATAVHQGEASQSAGPGLQTWGHGAELGNRERG